MDNSAKKKKDNLKDSKQQVISSGEPSLPYVYINEDLITKVGNEYDLTKITVLNFHLKLKGEAKIKKIEGLSKLINLEELNLSYNLISYIENLESLKQLRDLNLAENRIKKIENIVELLLESFSKLLKEMLTNLEKLNLNGNHIKYIPDSIRSLKKLSVLRLARNRIDDTEKLLNIQYLPCLKYFSISDNPINVSPGHLDFCLYLNPHIEMIDTKRVTDEHRRVLNKIFTLTQNRGKQGEIEQFTSGDMSFNPDTNKLKEENQRLKNMNRELEEENKSLREVLDGKNKELASNFEKISTLEQEIAQYKIDYIYSKLGNEKSNANISNYSSRSRDYSPYKSNQNEFSKIEKTINMLLHEKKENRNKVEELKREKADFWKELTALRENMQKLNNEVEFMSKKFMQSTADPISSPEKIKREKELQLASLQIQNEELKEKSMSLVTKIESTKEKIKKTEALIEKTHSSEDDENDQDLLKEKLEQLRDKLRGYEKSNDDIITALAGSNRELRALTEEIAEGTKRSTHKTSRPSLRSNLNVEEDSDLWKKHYQSNMEQLKTLKKKEAELVEKHGKTDLQLGYLLKQIESCESKVSDLYKQKSALEGRGTRDKSPEQQNMSKYKEDAFSFSEDSLRSLKVKILGLFASIKQIFSNVDEYVGENLTKTNVKEVEELIVGLNRDKNSGSKGVEDYIQRVCLSVDAFKGKIENVFIRNNESKREYEQKLEALKEVIEEKIRMEKDLRHELSQKDVEFERLMSKLKEEVANKETRLSIASGKMQEVKIKKEEIVQMIKKMLQKFDQFKKKIDDDNENEDNSFWVLEDNRTQRTNGEFDDLSEVLGKLKRVFRWIEKYLMKIDSFTTSKAKFIQELEKETKELGEKWQEFNIKKKEFKQKMMTEKDENLLKIRDEYKRLEEECQKLEINKKIWSEEKKKIEKERRDLMDEFYKNKEQMSFELKKEQEYKFTMKQGYEDEVLALRKQVETLRKEIVEYELKKERAKLEYDEIHTKSQLEINKHTIVKQEIDSIDKTQQQLTHKKNELINEIQLLEEEKKLLAMNVNEIKNQYKLAEDEHKYGINRMKEEEKTTKKIIEELHNEMSQKRDFINDLEFKLSSLTDELKMKQNEFSIIESKMEQFGKEKEVYRKNKFESVQLEKQMEEARLAMEEMVFKVNLQEESLHNVKNQVESANLILKEKQNEILTTEKNLNKLGEIVNDYQNQKEQLKKECDTKEEELRAIEVRKNELFNEYDKIYHRINEIEPDLATKEGELEGLTNEISQKMQEFEELNEMINENDSKYQKLIKENREILDKTMVELRAKEEEYHGLVMEIDRLSRFREEAQQEINKTERETQIREETLRNLYENIEHSQDEIQALNDKIISLTEKESDLEEKVQKYTELVQSYEAQIEDLERNIESLSIEEEDIATRVSHLQQKEDSIHILMALNGETLGERGQQRIRKLVENHYYIMEFNNRAQTLNDENNHLKEEISQLRKRLVKADAKLEASEAKNAQNRSKNSGQKENAHQKSFNYRLNFERGSLVGQRVSPVDSMKQDNLSSPEEGLLEPIMPLRESNRGNKQFYQEKERMSSTGFRNDGENFEGTAEDLYRITSEGTHDVKLVFQKIEEARKQINTLQQESQREVNENYEPYTSDFEASHGRKGGNFTIGEIGENIQES